MSDRNFPDFNLRLPYSPLGLALEEIRERYGNVCRAGLRSQRKYGRNDSVGTSNEADVSSFLTSSPYQEILPTGNVIDTISSSANADTGVFTIEGHRIENGVFVPLVQEVTLNGRSKVTLDQPLARVDRSYKQPTAPETAGDVYVYEDTAITNGVPTDNSKVHCKYDQDGQSSLKCAFTVPDRTYFIITSTYFSVNRRVTTNVDFKYKEAGIGGGFETRFVVAEGQGVLEIPELIPYRIVQPNTDVKVTALSNTNNTDVTAGISGYYAPIYEIL